MKQVRQFGDRLLIFGGPYSNYQATLAIQKRALELGIPASRVICTGDIIAYCAEPAETLELIRNWGIQVVMGNCEESLANDEGDCGCGFAADSECSILAVTWYEYASRRINIEQRRWMRELPRSIDFEMADTRFRVVHASLDSINEFVFASSDRETRLQQIREAGVDAVIGGHSGIPFGQSLGEAYWLNAGVIGMPANDGGNHGWYMLLEPRHGVVEASWHRLEYDHIASRESTIAAGMSAYGQALSTGLWPGTDVLPEIEAQQTGDALELPPLKVETGTTAGRSEAAAIRSVGPLDSEQEPSTA